MCEFILTSVEKLHPYWSSLVICPLPFKLINMFARHVLLLNHVCQFLPLFMQYPVTFHLAPDVEMWKKKSKTAHDKLPGPHTPLGKLLFLLKFLPWQTHGLWYIVDFSYTDTWCTDIDGLVQERCNSSVIAMELCLSCTNPSIESESESKQTAFYS